MQKILLLEDDLNLNRGIALLLSREGYEVRQVYTIKEAKEAFQRMRDYRTGLYCVTKCCKARNYRLF